MEGPEEGKEEQGGIRRSRSRKYNPAQSRSLGQENVRCRVYNYLEQPYDIFLRIPSNGVEGRWLVETMLIVRTGDT